MVVACASTPRASESGASESRRTGQGSIDGRRVRAIRLNLSETRICPGQRIHASYAAVLDDGSTRALDGGALAILTRQGDAVQPVDGGEWTSDPDPLASAVTGFRLSVWLTANPAVTAETTLVPVYSCSPRSFSFRGTGQGANGPDVTVRIAQVRSPFHDSVVVVAVEPANASPVHAMFLPSDLRQRRIAVASLGSAGRPGAAGRYGGATSPCANGEDGGDGQGGQQGGDGGQLTLIADGDQAWLRGVVELLTGGGAGGAGGSAGQGGPAGLRRTEPGTRVPCPATRRGRNGRAGTSGAAGGPGGAPKRLDSDLSLMWFGSQSYEDPKSSKALAALLNLTLHPRP